MTISESIIKLDETIQDSTATDDEKKEMHRQVRDLIHLLMKRDQKQD